MSATITTPGGSWLTGGADPSAVLTPERLSDEHRLIRQTVDEFVDSEVLPALGRLEQKDWDLARALVRRCGELGLLGVDVPDALGGLGLDGGAALLVVESIGRCPSFATTFGAQTGLAITPLLLFGTDDQKRRYVPQLVSGDIVGAYALSESGSGSDALGARARAIRQADGSYRLTGEKMWITNGGFADLFVVFAKAGGVGGGEADRLTAFLVDRTLEGVASGREEQKMGLHGSSTTPLVLQDVRVPAEHLLGELGKGHKVAFNVLNHGRCTLAAMCSGGAREALGQAASYAAGRKQFGKAIGSFGAVRHKLAEMAVRMYAVEAMLYRTVGLLDAALDGPREGTAYLAALEEFAVEASILKVAGSEMVDFVVDENVQIHGGNGYVGDYPAERQYRDARVNRIFEGTNEINRLLIPTMLARRAGRSAAGSAALAGDAAGPGGRTDTGPLQDALGVVFVMKRLAALVLETAVETCGSQLPEEQEVLSRTADVLIETYAADSALLRASAAASPLQEAAARVFVEGAAGRAADAAREALAALPPAGDRARAELRALAERPDVNAVALRRDIAAAVMERSGYPY